MQASTSKPTVENNIHDMFEQQQELNNAPSRSVDLAPDESHNSFIPYVLDPQHEDNISIDMIKLYQV